jgi:putative membrane protein
VATAKATRTEEKFFMKAGDGEQREVILSQYAAERASDAQVRDYAQRLVADHPAMAQDLTALALAKGVTLPSSEKALAEKKKLAENVGLDFDKAYLKRMIDAHEDAIHQFEKAAKDQDPQIQSFANKYLPALHDHLTAERNLKRNLP